MTKSQSSFKEVNPGVYYYIRRTVSGSKKGGWQKPTHRNWFLVRYKNDTSDIGYISIANRNVCVPANLVGKKVRIKLEVLD